ncbi:MAG: SRPBCC family protein, partial [Actinobacteria bacterium]|nr:SRPBCC family protein [Actinomycetota bacterium]
MADQTQSSIVIDASPAAIMAVIADLKSYPDWSDGINEVTVLAVYEEDNRPADARFNLASGAIKDIYELEYDWDGDHKVSWTLTKGDMLTAMDGVYELTDNGNATTTVDYR